MWLDADLNGRQDADEPAINGAVVELWTANANGAADRLVGTRVTSTINGQPGTYYFRTDDADVRADPANPTKPVFVPNAKYILVFKPGNGTGAQQLQLAGPNAAHAGFAGMTWSNLQLTTPQVRVAGKTTEVNDSNPQPDAAGSSTGRFAIDVGGPGQNNHTYDAGYFGTNTYQLEKVLDVPAGVAFDGPKTFTIKVDSAVNFRGENRLTASGSDPQITELTFTINPGTVTTTTQRLPFGYTLTFSETGDTTGATVTFTPPNGATTTQGRLTVTPAGAGDLKARLRVSNAYGGFTLQKLLDPGVTLPANTTFTVTYQIGNAAPVPVTLTAGAAPVRPVTTPIPYGTAITVCEPSPAIVGWNGGFVGWKINGVAAPATGANNCVTSTISAGGNQNLAFAVTNTFNEIRGTFSVDKTMSTAGNATIPGDTPFTIEYKVGTLDVGVAPQTLTVTPAGAVVGPGTDFPYDTVIYLREVLPNPPPTGVTWGTPTWTGTGGTATDTAGVVWQTVTIKVDDFTIALGVENAGECRRRRVQHHEAACGGRAAPQSDVLVPVQSRCEPRRRTSDRSWPAVP